MDAILTGDCLDGLGQMDANTFHACVTDPPYGLAFMGKSWDDFEPKEYQQWCEEWAREVKRVLKPGGHLLAFSGNRTHHRLFTGVEDAGFEIRDTITWHYGSGFPKALDVSKAIDKAADAEREVVDTKEQSVGFDSDGEGGGATWAEGEDVVQITEPATEAAKKWDGWKTALKPATEYVVVARKPFDSTVAECMQTHGTGALHIDACRVGTEERENAPPGENDVYSPAQGGHGTVTGRYPSNVVFDETQAEQLDAEVGELDTGDTVTRSNSIWGNAGDGDGMDGKGYEDTGGPSRYFYTSKATKAERTLDGKIENAHPTVKPQDLMEWLVKLVTAEEQSIVDPFAGSGTTCKAAKTLNRRFTGIEKQAKWADVARVRCGLTPNDPSVVRTDDNQQGLDNYAE